MTVETYGYDLEEVKQQYGGVEIATNTSAIFVRVLNADLPKGCQPKNTPVLLVLKPAQARPEIYVKPGIRLSNGREPQSANPVTIEGGSWLQFSYQFEFNKDTHSLVQFIECSLRRFAKNE